ncbi:sensor histidine kinase [Alicyclobacillus suci]|uniref:sensor histidine kinase n=1 Tax=Alicyclobacillus suci TaxID=2816080 RepID=UPI002E2A9E84|nr:HAMP domain-containing sensor histidine kinase [Alicyclobacillus suci]
MRERRLSARISWWSVVWCAIVLFVCTVLYTMSFHARTLQSYKRVLALEMAVLLGQGVDKLAIQGSASDWDRYAAVTDSAVRLANDRGDVLFEIGSPSFSITRMDAIIVKLSQQPFFANHSSSSLSNPVVWNDTYVWHDKTGTHHVIIASRRVKFLNGTSGTLQLFSLTDALMQETWRTMAWLAAIDVVVLALFALGMRWLTRRGLRPLKLLIDGIQEVEWRQSARIKLSNVPQEIESLQQSINQLLDRIDDGVKEQNRFIADASHELRTPLAIIAGHANLLRRWGHNNVRVWEPAVRNINSEVDRLQKLVNQLLVLARLEELPPRHVEGLTSAQLRELFQRLREDARVLRPDLDIVVRVHLTKNARAYIDADDLHQVLVVLMDNALRHTTDGYVELAAHGDEGMVRFTVTDTGEGIPEEVVAHVFDRFYRADGARKTESRGAGLGLAICKRLVESYQGRIYLRTKLGRGTTVIIRLPAQECPSPVFQSTDELVPKRYKKEKPRDDTGTSTDADATKH